ncbi:MAG: Hpt domain-containing protein [Euryarchaeota archaeon]|nr:Hpt domain-containing protein [Euryarchaeota archaeon]
MSGPALNDTCLEGLRHLDARQPGFLAEIYGVFLEDADERLDHIRTGLAEGDADKVAKAAHALKGASGGVCASTLSTLLQAIEQAGRAGDLTAARDGLEAVEAEYSRVRAAIADLLGTS